MTEQEQRLDQLAQDVLRLSRNTLLVNLRFLDAALSQFAYRPAPACWPPTDSASTTTPGPFSRATAGRRSARCGTICIWCSTACSATIL